MKKTIVESAKGFTLIELLIVVAIIGILAAVAIPNYMRARDKAKFGACRESLAGLKTAMESYMTESVNGEYTADGDAIALEMIAKSGAAEADLVGRINKSCAGDSGGADWAITGLSVGGTGNTEFCAKGYARSKVRHAICVSAAVTTPETMPTSTTAQDCSCIQ